MSAPRPLVAANWKCNGTHEATVGLINVFNLATMKHDVDCVVAPSFLHIGLVQANLRNPKFAIAAQNAAVKSGAFTGEVSVEMLLDAGIRTVILGHSERRSLYGETNEIVASKVAACVNAGMQVILCIGEDLKANESGKTEEVLLEQLNAVAAKVAPGLWSRIALANEPTYSIGTGRPATPEHIERAHRIIRNWLVNFLNHDDAHRVRILYGGSVTGKNAAQLYAIPNVNGFLVGGASLKPEFVEIIAATAARSSL